jgi:cytoskeletal protein RodZ
MSALPNSIPSPRNRKSKKSKQQLAQLSQRRQSPKTQNGVDKERSKAASANDHKARIWESGLVLGMNAVLISTALVTLAQLVPYQLTQREKLKEINREESQVAQNLQELQETFKRSQSPETAQRIAQEQGSLMRADQLKVFQVPQSLQRVQ